MKVRATILDIIIRDNWRDIGKPLWASVAALSLSSRAISVCWRSILAGGLQWGPSLPLLAFGDGEGSPPLSFSTVQFPICGVRSHLRGCGFSSVPLVLVSPVLTSMGLGFS